MRRKEGIEEGGWTGRLEGNEKGRKCDRRWMLLSGREEINRTMYMYLCIAHGCSHSKVEAWGGVERQGVVYFVMSPRPDTCTEFLEGYCFISVFILRKL